MRQDDRGYGGGRPGQPYQERRQLNYEAMTQYYDADNRLRREVFIDWPRQIADSIRVSRSNMRRAYDFVSAMRFRIRMGKEPDASAILMPGMGQLHRFVQYQAGRDRAWDEARSFFQSQINAVGNDEKKFEGFYQLFQSVMAYLRRN